MSINQLYTQMLLEHSKNKKNHREIEYTHLERGHNPNCGDDLTLLVKLKDRLIEDASFVGFGCAISQASISIMIDLIKGKTLEEAEELLNIYLRMIQSEDITDEEFEKIGDAAIFEGLSEMPARVKCGTLGWHCLKVIVEKEK